MSLRILPPAGAPRVLAASIAVASFLFIRSFVPFLLVMCLYATAQCGLAAARQALLAGLVDRAARTGVQHPWCHGLPGPHGPAGERVGDPPLTAQAS
ncbi:hypothetical protein [Streptomyces platensis]|uniref:hypothetical protein n=1 Tax=Streptomyces platensis TaxID=58346 RepID=UPI00386B31D5